MATKVTRRGDNVLVTIADGQSLEIELSDQEDASEHQDTKYAIKAKGDNGFGGYTAVWGDPTRPDLQGEYFAKDTDFAEEAYATRPLIHHHGQNRHLDRTIIGTIRTWKKDEIGLWCEGDFKSMSDDVDLFDDEERALRAEYIARIREKIAAGELNFSSGAVSHLTKYADDGKVKMWWWAESSSTGSPAEPRLTDIKLLKACKGLDIEIPAKDAIAPPEPVVPQEAVFPGSETGNKPEDTANPGEQTMTPEELIEEVLSSFSAGIADGTITPEMVESAAARLMEMVGEREEAVAALTENDEDEDDKAADEDEEPKTDTERLAAAMAAPDAAELMAEIKTMVEGMINSPKLTPDKVKSLLAATPIPRGSGGVNPAPAYKANQGVTDVKTKYEASGWEAADYAFVAMVMQKTDPRWHPDVDFQRSATAAATKYFEERNDGKLTNEKPFAGKAVDILARDLSFAQAAKANEVEHTTNTGFGQEWMPQSWSDSIFEKARMGNPVAQLFRRENMPTSPHNLRMESTDPTVYSVNETTAQEELTLTANNTIPISKIGTVSKQMVAGTLGVYIAISQEEIEDIGLDVVAFKRGQTDKAFTEAIDAILLNADASENGNINYNGAALAANSRFRYGGGDGLLHSPLVENNSLAVPSGAAPTLDLMWVLQEKLLEAYGTVPSNLAYICDVRAAQMLRRMEEVLTVDNYGPNATVLSGELGSLGNVPILMSDQMKKAAPDGFISSTANNNKQGRILLMYKPNWYLGERRALTLNVVDRDGMGATTIMGTMRMAVQKFDTSSASVLYNITITN